MSELTKEYFDKQLSTRISASEKRIVKRIDEAQEELAGITANGFEDIHRRFDVSDKIQIFEKKFQKLEESLQIKL